MAEASGWNPFLLDTKHLPPLISWGWVSATAATPVTLTSPILAVKRINAGNGRQRLKAPPTLLSSTNLQDGLGLLASLLVFSAIFRTSHLAVSGSFPSWMCFALHLLHIPEACQQECPMATSLSSDLLDLVFCGLRVGPAYTSAACLTALLQTLCKPRRTISRCIALCFCSGDCSARNAFLPYLCLLKSDLSLKT